MGGFCPPGHFLGGDYVQGGFCPGGLCPGGIMSGGDFVLHPIHIDFIFSVQRVSI